mmetsp:Transcript_4241/g.9190  ORF Transcript_4241/g.9190 Transcript_4241/m.9190 type:complete len:201 (+) Transcript_4241:55-657(+)
MCTASTHCCSLLTTTHYSLLTTAHYSPPPLTTHSSLLTAHRALLTTHHSLLTTHYLLLTPLTTHCSPLTAHSSQLTAHCSLLTIYCSPPRRSSTNRIDSSSHIRCRRSRSIAMEASCREIWARCISAARVGHFARSRTRSAPPRGSMVGRMWPSGGRGGTLQTVYWLSRKAHSRDVVECTVYTVFSTLVCILYVSGWCNV